MSEEIATACANLAEIARLRAELEQAQAEIARLTAANARMFMATLAHDARADRSAAWAARWKRAAKIGWALGRKERQRHGY